MGRDIVRLPWVRTSLAESGFPPSGVSVLWTDADKALFALRNSVGVDEADDSLRIELTEVMGLSRELSNIAIATMQDPLIVSALGRYDETLFSPEHLHDGAASVGALVISKSLKLFQGLRYPDGFHLFNNLSQSGMTLGARRSEVVNYLMNVGIGGEVSFDEVPADEYDRVSSYSVNRSPHEVVANKKLCLFSPEQGEAWREYLPDNYVLLSELSNGVDATTARLPALAYVTRGAVSGVLWTEEALAGGKDGFASQLHKDTILAMNRGVFMGAISEVRSHDEIMSEIGAVRQQYGF